MRHRAGTRKWLVGWTAVGVAIVGVTSAGIANAATSNAPTAGGSTASASGTPKAVRAKALLHIERKLAHNVTHGEIQVDTKKGLQTIDFQRGTVSDASSGGFTVTDKGGTVENWVDGPKLKVRQRAGKGSKASSGQIVNGENVVVIGVNGGGNLTALVVVVLPAAQATPQSTTPPTN
jgi:hypothetical protein